MHLMCLNFFFLFFSPPGFILLKFKNNLRCPKHFAPPPSSPSCCPVSSEGTSLFLSYASLPH
ncbi:hypothetical protein I3843_04G086700 [Carya illinoinensis]|nr:hypothetical protein I3843_04G086700 [Carya illinoinensis]KAG7983092.1 hypothetical protein I3843_04G086700 [Carya illinoinensis]KAG7983093.1 hypothetical protein I3843_04G086700 [Carya illinoinensis]KAG7983095.1 hypothetical protein I3843_04G086700 [Carya illinoinensis]